MCLLLIHTDEVMTEISGLHIFWAPRQHCFSNCGITVMTAEKDTFFPRKCFSYSTVMKTGDIYDTIVIYDSMMVRNCTYMNVIPCCHTKLAE